jgi:hypothetical protein
MLTRPADYVMNPQGYSSSLTKREHFALSLATGLLSSGMRMSKEVTRAAIILADNLIENLNDMSAGVVRDLDEPEVEAVKPVMSYGKK